MTRRKVNTIKHIPVCRSFGIKHALDILGHESCSDYSQHANVQNTTFQSLHNTCLEKPGKEARLSHALIGPMLFQPAPQNQRYCCLMSIPCTESTSSELHILIQGARDFATLLNANPWLKFLLHASLLNN